MLRKTSHNSRRKVAFAHAKAMVMKMQKKFAVTPPAYGVRALEILEENGFEAWFVGGCVRDFLLGLSPGDWDITTSARPEEILRCFAGFRCIETGIRHGTVTVLIEEQPVEITTYRSDGAYRDHRHPEEVKFSRQLEDDLSRRDFTVNAMAYHPERGLVDKYHGVKDLEEKRIRCVGDPDRRFTEDALRILRCLRFSSRLGFSIESATADALRRQKKLLPDISHERVKIELEKLLVGDHAEKILREYFDVLFVILPELAPMKGCTQERPYHCFDVWEHTLHAVGAAPNDPIVRWAVLFHDCGKPGVKTYEPEGVAHFYGHDKESARIADICCERLRFSNREREAVCALVARHGEPLPMPEKRVKRLLGKLGEEQLFRLFALMRGDVSAQSPAVREERLSYLEDCKVLAKKLIEDGQCLTLRDLAVNGNDLLALGFSKNRLLGTALQALLDEVLAGTLPNEKEVLLEEAKKFLKQ